MEIATQPFDYAWPHVLAQLGNATIKVTWYTPIDLGSASAVCPVFHEAFGVSRMIAAVSHC
jgi:hypothetical protein